MKAVWTGKRSFRLCAPVPLQHVIADRHCLVAPGLIKPVAYNVADALEPITQDITRGVLQPLAKGVAENAVPLTNQFTDETLLPAADKIAAEARAAPARISCYILVTGCILLRACPSGASAPSLQPQLGQ